jgi:cytochrome c553
MMKQLMALLGMAALAAVLQAPASAADHAAVGPEKCKMCHKIQYESWSKSKHATAEKKTECETCHGNGADYMKITIMKDPVKAKEAGLIAKPEMAACVKCHTKPDEIKPEMLAKVHDHKPKS